MMINAISPSMITPTTHVVNNAPVRERHPHLSIEGVTQPPSEQLEAARAFQTAIRGFGVAIQTSTQEILAGAQSLFDNMVGTSSDEQAVSVSVANNYTNGGSRNGTTVYVNGTGEGASTPTQNTPAQNGNGEYATAPTQINSYEATLQVYQVAAAQQNTGTALPAMEISQAQNGQNNFTLERNGNTYDFSVNVSETMSNRTVQQYVANAVNDQLTGIRAEIEANAPGQSALVLTAVSTGENNAFTIADAQGSNVIASLGVDQVTREAQNAFYAVNGEEYSASTNTVYIAENLNATLQEATAEMPVTAAAQRDVDSITEAINELVQSFNEMRTAAAEYAPNDPNADTLRRRLDHIYYDNESALASMGITREDQQLQINEEQLAAAIENDTAEEQLANPFGYAGQLSRLAEALTEDPTNYAMNLNMAVL